MRSFPLRITSAALLVAATASCSSSSGESGPGFTAVSELNAVWTLTGTYQFLCNSSPVSVTITSEPVVIYNGTFDSRIDWPSQVCSVSSVLLTGSVLADGSLIGTAALPNGALSDSIGGKCNLTSCDGETVNTTEFTFSLARTPAGPFDGGGWGITLNCNGGVPFGVSNATVTDGQYTAPNSTTRICADNSSTVVANPVSETFTLSFQPTGEMTATLTQGTAATINFAGTMTGLTDIAADGDLGGTRMFINRNDPD